MRLLPQLTSGTHTVKFGPFVDEDNGYTPETGLTITQALTRLSKNEGNFAQKNESSSASHDENGWYDVTFDSTDLGTLGTLVVALYVSGALPVWERFMVVPQGVYNVWATSGNGSLELHHLKLYNDEGTIPLDVDSGPTCGGTAARIRAQRADETALEIVAPTGAGSGDSHAISIVGAGYGELVKLDQANGYDAVMVDAVGAGSAFRLTGGAIGVRIASNDVGLAVYGGSGGTAGHAVSLTAGEQAGSAAIRAHGPNTVEGRAIDLEGGHGANSEAVQIVAPTGKGIVVSVYDEVAVHLQALGSGSGGVQVDSNAKPALDINPSNASGVDIDADGYGVAIDTTAADAVHVSSTDGWAVTLFGTDGALEATAATNIDAIVITAAGTGSALKLGATGGGTGLEVSASLAVWLQAATSYGVRISSPVNAISAISTGNHAVVFQTTDANSDALSLQGGASGKDIDAKEIDALATNQATIISNQGGLSTQNANILADTGSLITGQGALSAQNAAILVDTGNLLSGQSAIAGILGTPVGASLAADIAAVQATTTAIQTTIGTAGAGLTDLGGMSSGMKAEVLVEANAALDAAIAEPGVGVPGATQSARQILAWVWATLRNKGTSNSASSEKVFYNGAGTALAKKAFTDDGTTYTEQEMAAV